MSAGFSAVWLRQFLPEMTHASDVDEVDDRLAVREQWRTWLTDLAEAPTVRWMNPLWASRRAENKLVQLRTAHQLGLPVPATLLTNHRLAARDHARAVGPCVVKTATSAYHAFSDSSFVFTRPLDDALAAADEEWSAQPLVVQQEIRPRRDVRVLVVDQFAAAAATRVDGSDWRTNSHEAQWVAYPLTDQLEAACVALVSSLGLAYGALDFADDGETAWFLECNQAGEFAFIDVPLDLGVTARIAQWLAR